MQGGKTLKVACQYDFQSHGNPFSILGVVTVGRRASIMPLHSSLWLQVPPPLTQKQAQRVIASSTMLLASLHSHLLYSAG